MATQNPIEQEGTYLLAEAQTDRFYLKEKITYPTEEELEIINRIEKSVFDNVKVVSSLEEIKYLQEQTKKVYMYEFIKKYILNIARYPKKYMNNKYAEYMENVPSSYFVGVKKFRKI